jgi:1,2-diacylglycerol 3-alpha-glucosyltransferase
MNICMFTNTYLPHIGGVARSVSTFVEDLQAAGHCVLVVAPTFPGVRKTEEHTILRVPAIQNFNGSDFSVPIPLSGATSEEIEAFNPDIIHSHHPFLLGDTALRTARSLDIPLVFTHHTLYEQYTHYVPLDSPALKTFVIELATEYANLCNQVIAPSTSIEKLLIKRGVKSDISVLPTGIDLDFFGQGERQRFCRKYQIPQDFFVIGHVGRLAVEKNLPYLARSVAAALKHEKRSCFLIAGTGDAEKEIEDVFREADCSDRLIMTGSLSGTDLADCYAAMDIFVFASHSETQGLVLAEAMAASTPVIALSASGVDDVLENYSNGIMLPADAPENTFTESLVTTINDPGERRKWSKEAHNTAGKFSRQSSTDKLIALYETTISGKYVPHETELDMLDTALLAIKTEWELLQEKLGAAMDTFREGSREN